MAKKYNSNKVKSYKSYSISDIARLFKEDKLHDKTIRSWIRQGYLESFKDGNKILIYGAILKSFLNSNNQNLKEGKLKLNQIKCFKCQHSNEPLNKTIYVEINNNKTPKIIGVCPNCGFKFSKLIKATLINDLKQTMLVDHKEVNRLYDCFNSGQRTHPIKFKKTKINTPLNPDYKEAEQINFLDF